VIVNAELQSLLDTVRRLDAIRAQLPRSLVSHEARQRDGPREGHGPLPAPERGHRPHSQPQPHV